MLLCTMAALFRDPPVNVAVSTMTEALLFFFRPRIASSSAFRGATFAAQKSGSVTSQAQRMADVHSLQENAPSSPPPSSAPRTLTVIFGSPITESTVCRLIGNSLEAKLPAAILGSGENPGLFERQLYSVDEFGTGPARVGATNMIPAIRRHLKIRALHS